MHMQPNLDTDWHGQQSDALPAPLDSESLLLLRGFLTPIFETATDWRGLTQKLGEKGYGLALRHGRLVVIDRDSGSAICTGQSLGVPLRSLAGRIGRPVVSMAPGGTTAALQV
ncbi:hypothetical protein VK792_00555 [Mesobacterium sp. TK19101]|uniref:Uncharacterized protein n=1 Tax=Mesobacterium hydrothermale TaxID=3111907 RepID=A0ABU6HBD6_9RHOB|nr:hypothetical protein [Mesobacterium sp. TK19101]MEC3859758.1 hypothetical protein [Mesobacterium sp. TK19101]